MRQESDVELTDQSGQLPSLVGRAGTPAQCAEGAEGSNVAIIQGSCM